MSGVVVVDAGLMVLLVVGSASKTYIAKHRRLRQDFSIDDFELLGLILKEFSDLIVLPHILVEVSSLARQIENPARAEIQRYFRTLITTATELPIPSLAGAQRNEFAELGLTDAVILHFCEMSINGIHPTLVTTDGNLANRAYALGYGVINYKEEFQSG